MLAKTITKKPKESCMNCLGSRLDHSSENLQKREGVSVTLMDVLLRTLQSSISSNYTKCQSFWLGGCVFKTGSHIIVAIPGSLNRSSAIVIRLISPHTKGNHSFSLPFSDIFCFLSPFYSPLYHPCRQPPLLQLMICLSLSSALFLPGSNFRPFSLIQLQRAQLKVGLAWGKQESSREVNEDSNLAFFLRWKAEKMEGSRRQRETQTVKCSPKIIIIFCYLI